MNIQVNKGFPTRDQLNDIRDDAQIVLYYQALDYHERWISKCALNACIQSHVSYYKNNVTCWYVLPTKEEFDAIFNKEV